MKTRPITQQRIKWCISTVRGAKEALSEYYAKTKDVSGVIYNHNLNGVENLLLDLYKPKVNNTKER